MEIIQRLAAFGSTIILCTHILADVERVANKIGILRNGVMAVEGRLQDVVKQFVASSAIFVQLNYAPLTTDPICMIDLVERSEIGPYGVTLYAKPGVNEAEFFYKVITTLAANRIVPESVGFRRMTLEQIYLDVNNGRILPIPPTMWG
jgi:ABC-type multidrug transport system ATPase subunit